MKYAKKYKDYEEKELSRRAAKRKKIAAYKTLVDRSRVESLKKKISEQTGMNKNRELSAKAFTKTIGNPYSVKFKKANKKLKKIKRK